MPEPRISHWASTERTRAEITLAGQVVVTGELHLQPRVAHHEGAETPLEMLNRPDPFFPVTLGGGEIAFLAKAQVLRVACDPSVLDTDPERHGAVKTIGLEVRMADGTEHRGRAELELPPTRARALDYLNSAGQFFALLGGGALHFLNRDHVRVVRPID